jgi:hypothetical protein
MARVQVIGSTEGHTADCKCSTCTHGKYIPVPANEEHRHAVACVRGYGPVCGQREPCRTACVALADR